MPLYYVKLKQSFTGADMTTNNVFVRGLPSNIVELAREADTARSLRTLLAANTLSYRFKKAA